MTARAQTATLLAGLAGVVAAAATAQVIASSSGSELRSMPMVWAQGGDEDFEPHALVTASEAYTRALELFPDSHTPLSNVVRLKTRLNAQSWVNQATPVPGDYDPAELARPAWIVGIRANSLTDCEVVSFAPCDNTTVWHGLYYILDARNAMVISIGVMDEGLYQALESLDDDSVEVVFATPVEIGGTPAGATPLFEIVTPTASATP